MGFKINRFRVVSSEDAGFSDLLSALPDGVSECLYCGQPAGPRFRASVAMVLIADESDESPLAVYSAVCRTCSTLHPKDQILADWAEGLVDMYDGPDIPDPHESGRA